MAYTAIGLGTLSGGWRIIKTMGSKITKLQPIGGFRRRDRRGARHLHRDRASGSGISTTHTITGAIVGVGVDADGCRPCAGASPARSSGRGC